MMEGDGGGASDGAHGHGAAVPPGVADPGSARTGGAPDGAAAAWFRPAVRALAARAKPYGTALVASALLGGICVRAVLEQAGHPALPLDDAFIHMQYARRLAEGGFFSYVAGAGYTSGATSVLWPLLLAPFYALGLRDLSLVYALWALGIAFHAALAVETARLARPLTGPAAAAGAGAMSLAFGAFAWFAWSGMETVAFAWILTRTARLAAAWCEPDADGARRPASTASAAALAACGFAAPLLRPEGALASLLAAAALMSRPPLVGASTAAGAQTTAGAPPARRRSVGRLLALVPLTGALLVPVMNTLLAGHPTSSTTTVKWLIGNPTYDRATLWTVILDNVKLLLSDVLDGGAWTAVFLPQGSSVIIYLGAAALAVAGYRRQLPAHAAVVAVVALGTLLPCTYLSFLWNRVRYVWPFAPAWFVMAACLASEIGDAVQRRRRGITYVAPLLTGAFAGALAMRLPWTIRDLAQSARAIDRQQVLLGRWASENLPPDAIVGVNDTGAIAYFSGRKTFDVVGLTTEGEAPYWVAGPGSRFEHYEHLPRDRRPTHFIVYPQWMACSPVLGEPLTEATVIDQSILGGATMVAYEARWDTLGTGALPMRMLPGERVLDDIDVSDLGSEEAHAYALDPLSDQYNQAMLLSAPQSDAPGELDEARQVVADGGRLNRRIDRFRARAKTPAEARLVMRVAAGDGAELAVSVAGRDVGVVAVPPGAWVERAIAIPAATLSENAPVEIAQRRGASFHAFHYWIVGR